jgi:hypothetical protein
VDEVCCSISSLLLKHEADGAADEDRLRSPDAEPYQQPPVGVCRHVERPNDRCIAGRFPGHQVFTCRQPRKRMEEIQALGQRRHASEQHVPPPDVHQLVPERHLPLGIGETAAGIDWHQHHRIPEANHLRNVHLGRCAHAWQARQPDPGRHARHRRAIHT